MVLDCYLIIMLGNEVDWVLNEKASFYTYT